MPVHHTSFPPKDAGPPQKYEAKAHLQQPFRHTRMFKDPHRHRCARRDSTLNGRYITDFEIAQRQLDIRRGAQSARTGLTLTGVRQLIGNTLIALGTMLHGPTSERTVVKPAVLPAHSL